VKFIDHIKEQKLYLKKAPHMNSSKTTNILCSQKRVKFKCPWDRTASLKQTNSAGNNNESISQKFHTNPSLPPLTKIITELPTQFN